MSFRAVSKTPFPSQFEYSMLTLALLFSIKYLIASYPSLCMALQEIEGLLLLHVLNLEHLDIFPLHFQAHFHIVLSFVVATTIF